MLNTGTLRALHWKHRYAKCFESFASLDAGNSMRALIINIKRLWWWKLWLLFARRSFGIRRLQQLQ